MLYAKGGMKNVAIIQPPGIPRKKHITQKALADQKVSGERYISALENGKRQTINYI